MEKKLTDAEVWGLVFVVIIVLVCVFIFFFVFLINKDDNIYPPLNINISNTNVNSNINANINRNINVPRNNLNIPTNAVPLGSCQDSDGGLDYYRKGTVNTKTINSTGNYFDSCINRETQVQEWYCSGGIAQKAIFTCPGKCEDGACVEKTAQECTDSDGGRAYYTKGVIMVRGEPASGTYFDICLNDNTRMNEWHCEDDIAVKSVYTCPYGCEEGACKYDENMKGYKQSGGCTDSDEGYDPYSLGTVFSNNKSGESIETPDRCLNDTVMEGICVDGGHADNSRSFLCPHGCQNGACIK